MQIHEVLNMPLAEIKAKRSEIAAGLQSAADLTERFVQTLIDAKQRDEKLSEQGVTITNLNQMIEQLRADLIASEELAARRQTTLDEAMGKVEELDREVHEVQRQLRDQVARADRNAELSKQYAAAVTTAEKALQDALDAAKIESVNAGES